MLPNLTLPTSNLYILYQLKLAGYEAFLVGGSVRDLLANNLHYYGQEKILTPLDFDFTTNATPEEILQVFPDGFYENKFGTVSLALKYLPEFLSNENQEKLEKDQKTIVLEEATKLHESLQLPQRKTEVEKAENFEITTYRTGEKYELNRRHPSEVTWGKNITDDLSRRDFTINALALTISLDKLKRIFENGQVPAKQYQFQADEYTLIDQFGGLKDLNDNLIKAIGEPEQRFQEDALRLLRAIRFSVQLNFGIEERTFEAVIKQAKLIEEISQERITDELCKMLKTDYPKEAIMLLDETGLLQIIIPELIQTKKVDQSGHHLTDVWQHSLDSLAACANPDPIVRLAALMHDIGKPVTQKKLGDKYTFYNHQVVGAHMVKKIAQRLKLSRIDIQRLFILVRQHMFYYQRENTDASIRRFMRQVGLENLNDILDVREADRLGSNAKKTSWRLEEMKQRMIEQLHQPMQVRDLAIDGHDLMEKFGLKPSPVLGKILNQLLEIVLEESDFNEREKLLQKAEEILKGEAENNII